MGPSAQGRQGEFAVIGAGPAGLMAAETLSAAGARVTVYERMPSVARKFLLAGRGGLNLTHSEPLDLFLARYGEAASRLEPFLRRFSPAALRAWAADLGEETTIGSSGRVFPASWKASPLLRAWLRRLDASGVRFALRHRWTGFGPNAGLCFETPDGPRSVEKPAATILALGGGSWPRLGSDGSWAAILERAGISSAPLAPANCGLRIAWSDRFAERFGGEPLKRIAVTFAAERRRGEALVTRTGLEGGVVYAVSAAVRNALARGETASLLLDLRPDLSLAQLAGRLAKPRERRSASTFLRREARLEPVAVALLREAVGPTLPGEPEGLARLVKAVPLQAIGTAGLDRAISSAGGILFDDLDDRLMLRGLPGIFAAGEMLDWEAPTGGYLLQACFATGVAAAEGALAWIARP